MKTFVINSINLQKKNDQSSVDRNRKMFVNNFIGLCRSLPVNYTNFCSSVTLAATLFRYHFFCTSLTILLFFFPKVVFSEKLLIMITDINCPYCQAWEKEVGSVYPKTDLSHQFRLVRVEFGAPLTKFIPFIDQVRGTPTFIFLRDNAEIGRIEGFSDAEMFWWLVDDIVNQAENFVE